MTINPSVFLFLGYSPLSGNSSLLVNSEGIVVGYYVINVYDVIVITLYEPFLSYPCGYYISYVDAKNIHFTKDEETAIINGTFTGSEEVQNLPSVLADYQEALQLCTDIAENEKVFSIKIRIGV